MSPWGTILCYKQYMKKENAQVSRVTTGAQQWEGKIVSCQREQLSLYQLCLWIRQSEEWRFFFFKKPTNNQLSLGVKGNNTSNYYEYQKVRFVIQEKSPKLAKWLFIWAVQGVASYSIKNTRSRLRKKKRDIEQSHIWHLDCKPFWDQQPFSYLIFL